MLRHRHTGIDTEEYRMKTIDIVFVSQDDLIGPDNLTFVEIERDGVSINLSGSEWVRRDDGYLVLRIPDPEAT